MPDKVSILLVDDRPENLLALEACLEGLGQRLVRASSGEEALRCLLKEDFAVILLDVQMPGMGGFETAELIKSRERTRHIPIIFLTAMNKSETQVFKGYSVGAVDYLFKPFDPDIMRSKVQVFVELFLSKRKIQRQAEDLERANEALRELDHYKDEFLSVISHELRTPLNFIMGFASILDDEVAGPMSDQQHAYLSKILSGADRMLGLVNDLLDMAKFRAGRFDLYPAWHRYPLLIEEVLTTLKPLADQKRLRVIAEVPAELDVWVDGPRIIQLATNLVGNAIKFTPDGGTILVRAWAEKGGLVTEVVDSGVGIAPEDLSQLFVRFKQLDMSSTREVGGTGLGLSISKALVEAHGGTISATSAGVGKGATFRFDLPSCLPGSAPSTAEAFAV